MVSQRRAGVVLGYANIIVKNLVNLVYTPMLLSFVGQADYGVYQSCNSFVFSLTLLSFGFSQAYVRFYTQKKINGTEADIRRLNGVYLVLYVVVSAAALALGLAFAANAGSIFSAGFTADQVATARSVIAVLSASIAVTLFNSVFDAHVLAQEEFRFQQTRQLATTLATPFAAYALLCLGMGVVGVALAQLGVNVLLLLLNASFCIGKLGMRFDVRHFDRALFRAIAVFSGWIFMNQICDLVNQNVPNVLLGALSGASAVAVFAVSVQIRSVFMSLSSTMSTVFTPEINRIVAASDDNSALTDLMARVGRYQMVLFCWVYGGFAVLGRFFVSAWASPGFSDAYWLVLIMVAPLVFPLTQNTGIEIQRAKNRHRARSVVYLATALLNLALTAMLAGELGYWAPVAGYVAYVLVACGAFMNWYYQRRIGLDMARFWRCVLPAAGVGVVSAAACLVATHFIPVSSWVSFVAWGTAYTALYGALTVVLVLTPGERATLSRKLRRR
jgi:O-antigen/teichoic acid export membrane protein